MRQLSYIFLLLLLLVSSSRVYAIFCPSNFSQIDMGYTTQQVLEICGKPDYQNTYTKTVYSSEELIYYVKTSLFNPSTAKLNIVINNGQVVNITITENTKVCQSMVPGNNSQQNVFCQTTQQTKSLGSTNACGPMISVGDSAESVQTACGQPAFVNHGQKSGSDTLYTEFRYNGPPSISLIFENGLLVNRVQN